VAAAQGRLDEVAAQEGGAAKHEELHTSRQIDAITWPTTLAASPQ
jgi:hypothetical protein